MNITIETAENAAAYLAAANIREQVFGHQHYYCTLPRLDAHATSQTVTLVARVADTRTPVAALSIVETTNDKALHNSLGLTFPETARVARYSQMAVLKPYRGLHIPARLIAEGRRRFIVPKQFSYTWLLFPADTARASFFCTEMGFEASGRVFPTEYGRSRVLVCSDRALEPAFHLTACLNSQNGP